MADPIDILSRFDALQEKLGPLWQHIGRSDLGSSELQEPHTLVVVPSVTSDLDLDYPSQQGYEERMLFLLLILRQPHLRVVYLTSMPIAWEVVDYYLDILPSVSRDNARRRLILLSPQDASERPLVNKLLDRPRLLETVRQAIGDPELAHLVPFTTTDFERELAVHLGIPMYAADPRYFAFGTKSGCRRLFRQIGLPLPMGFENLTSPDDLAGALAKMRRARPDLSRVVVKLNEGVSGFGNALLDLAELPDPGDPAEEAALVHRLQKLRFELADLTYQSFMQDLAEKGGIVEEMISADEVRSPSAQMRITPLGEVELLSTHDQMLGGPTGQIYLGARFPADPAYGPAIMRAAELVGTQLASEGVVGRFAVDFIVVRTEASWEPYAIEINLRKGGTTHPFLTMQYLMGGRYHVDEGVYYSALGQPKYYVATDTLKKSHYRQLRPADLIDFVSNHRLHYDHVSQTGVVLHMFSMVGALGKLGLTAIGDSPQHAAEIYQRFIRLLDESLVAS